MDRPRPLARHRYYFLFAALLLFFVCAPFLTGASGRSISAILFLLVMTGVMSAVGKGWPARIGIILGIVVAAIMARNMIPPAGGVTPVEAGARALFLALASGVILGDVVRAREVTLNTVLGAACVYLLLGVLWAHLFMELHLLDPAAFRGQLENAGSPGMPGSLFYLSFVTLTTLGFGDIVPVTPAARVLTVFEALTGQLFLVILVARMVSLEVAQRFNRRSDA